MRILLRSVELRTAFGVCETQRCVEHEVGYARHVVIIDVLRFVRDLDSYSGSLSAIWKASTAGALTFGDGLGGTYALTGRFHGDSIFIAVPDVLTDGTAHTGLYTFVRQP